METHSNILAWEIPWAEEPRSLKSMGLQRGEYDLATKQQQLYKYIWRERNRKLLRGGHSPT